MKPYSNKTDRTDNRKALYSAINADDKGRKKAARADGKKQIADGKNEDTTSTLKFPFGHPSQKQPKYKVGDKMKHPKTLYGETEGVIESIERLYWTTFPGGSFDMSSLVTSESTIPSFCVPYDFDGETLVVHTPASTINLSGGGQITQPARSRSARFYGYAYTIRTPKMLSQFKETSIKPLKN